MPYYDVKCSACRKTFVDCFIPLDDIEEFDAQATAEAPHEKTKCPWPGCDGVLVRQTAAPMFRIR